MRVISHLKFPPKCVHARILIVTANLKTTVEHIVTATQVQWGFLREGDGSECLNYVPLAHFFARPMSIHCKKKGVHDTHVVCIWRQIWCVVHTHLFLLCTPVVQLHFYSVWDGSVVDLAISLHLRYRT